MTGPDDYGWVEAADDALSALTITLVQPNDEETIRALRPRSEYPEPMTFTQALTAAFAIPDWAYGAVLVQIDILGDWAVLLEPAGWASSDPDRLAILSTRGTAVSVFWNVNANMQFGLARGRALIRLFDPLLYVESSDALAEEREFEWGVGHPRASALGLMERLTGEHFDIGCLLGSRRRSFVVPL